MLVFLGYIRQFDNFRVGTVPAFKTPRFTGGFSTLISV